MRQQLEQLVEPRLEVERLEERLLFLGADVHQAGDEVGEPRGALYALERGHHFFGHLRQQLQYLHRALLEIERAPLDVRVDLLRLLDELHARDGERIAFEELQHAEALHALADRVMRAVGRRDVAQHVGGGADPVQIVGTRLFDFRLALQQDAERALQARGFLRAAARERSRPMVSGTTTPGNSTTLRTGRMISASSGSGRDVPSVTLAGTPERTRPKGIGTPVAQVPP